MTEIELRQRARERILAGSVPNVPPDLLWNGFGKGELCAICDRPIMYDQALYEMDVSRGDNAYRYRLHTRCHFAWWLEFKVARNPRAGDASG